MGQTDAIDIKQMRMFAAVSEFGSFSKAAVMAVDLTSALLVTRVVIRPMREPRAGAIVSVASIAGKEGTP